MSYNRKNMAEDVPLLFMTSLSYFFTSLHI